jgi:tetratricopeptide (TPR) repeat protein
MVMVLTSRLMNEGKPKEALQTLQHFLDHEKTNTDAWLQTAEIYRNTGEISNAILTLDSALVYLPGNEKIATQLAVLRDAEYIKPYEALYNQANQVFAQQQYPEALRLLNDFISKKPAFLPAYQNRALCRYRTGDYPGSLLDIEKALTQKGANEAFLINLRGVNKISLGRTDEACVDFKFAMEKGDKDGIINYQRFCEQKK